MKTYKFAISNLKFLSGLDSGFTSVFLPRMKLTVGQCGSRSEKRTVCITWFSAQAKKNNTDFVTLPRAKAGQHTGPGKALNKAERRKEHGLQ